MRCSIMCLFVALIAEPASAAFVTAVTNGSGQGVGGTMSAIGTIDNGSGVLASIGTPLTPSAEGAGPRSINLTVTMLKKFSPLNIQIATRSVVGQSPIDRFYRLNLTIVNGLTYANSAHNFMNGFDFKDFDESGSGISTFVAGAPVADGGAFALENATPGTPNLGATVGWRFGGLKGGGPTIAPGASTTVSLTLRVNQTTASAVVTNRTSQFSITANPEPASLILGGLVLAPAFVALRKRRVQAKEIESSDLAV